MMEMSANKELIINYGKVVGKAKKQRKDKGKTRITAYMMWAKEARNDLLKEHPEMDFAAISKRLGEMWANVNYKKRELWKERAEQFVMQKEQDSILAANKLLFNQLNSPDEQVRRPPSKRNQQKHVSDTEPQPTLGSVSMATSSTTSSSSSSTTTLHASSGSAAEMSAHLRLLGENLAIIGERLKEHEVTIYFFTS